jgi:hypothetical protein
MREEFSLTCDAGGLKEGDDDEYEGVAATGCETGVLAWTAEGLGALAAGSGAFGVCEDGLGSGVFPHMESSWIKGWDSDAG